MLVRTTFTWPNGNVTRKVIDWNDTWQVQKFARKARFALARYATVSTVQVNATVGAPPTDDDVIACANTEMLGLKRWNEMEAKNANETVTELAIDAAEPV